MKIPNFFVIGAPKSGTSAMRQYLGSHPAVFMVPTPEPQYFGRDVNYWWFPPLDDETYRQLFADVTDESAIGEKSTSYLASRLAAVEIKAFSPEARIIAMLRNPVDMIYALHSEMLKMRFEDISDFETALATEADRRIGPRARHTDVSFVNNRFYWAAAEFSTQLQRYFDVFGRENVHVIIFDDLRSDTPGVYKKTLRFLEVSEDFIPDFPIVNSNKRIRLVSLLHPPQLVRHVAKTFVPKSLRQKLKRQLDRLNMTEKARRPMDPAVRRRLQERFAPEVERLGKIIDRDLSGWSA